MIKIAVVITDCGMAANIGGDPESKAHIISIPTDNLTPGLKRYLNGDAEFRKWKTLSISLVDEEI